MSFVRSEYFQSIEERLSFLAFRLETRGKLNILDLHLHSENFYQHFLNLLFDWDLKNINTFNQNAAAIDLIEENRKIVLQVSSTATKQKIETALKKEALSRLTDYEFKFISISKDASSLRDKKFSNPHNIRFEPDTDVYDIPILLKFINGLDIDRFKRIYEFIRKEIEPSTNTSQLDSNLTSVINILSKEDLNQIEPISRGKPFEIADKIEFNRLDRAKSRIEDYCVYHSRVDQIYDTFDRQGANKKLSILNSLRAEYHTSKSEGSPDECFDTIIERVLEKTQTSKNYQAIPKEELDLCVGILVVDAFVRCKIFENPLQANNYAHT